MDASAARSAERSERKQSGIRAGRRAPLALVLLAACALACASATKRYEQGAELEAQGRYAEAAQRYIQALRKDPGLPEARRHLAELGPKLIAERLGEADRYAAAGFQLQRADCYLSIDALVTDAASVGVPLVLPPGYAEGRRTALDAAIAQLLDVGAQAETEARWADALQAYEQIDAYDPGRRQVESVHAAQGRAWLLWAEADLGAGSCRAALGHADRALAVPGGLSPAARGRAQRLRAEALARGTVHVAVAPVRGAREAAVPAEFLGELNDELELRYWSQPPVFVAVIDPVRVRRELRAQDCAHGPLSPRQAARVGRALGADLAVSSEITALVARELEVQVENRRARTRSGQDTTYAVRKGKREYELSATYTLVDVGQGREAQQRSMDVSESQDFQEGVYAGDYASLELSAAERRLFDRKRDHDARHEAESRLIAQATDRLADGVYADILNRVP